MKTVVVFQGGGALGAFAAGAWARLQPWLRDGGHELVALAGASIGAVNAALVAADAQRDPHVLERAWCDGIATPSLPLLGWAWGDSEGARTLRSWNGLLDGLLVGSRGLCTPAPINWTPWAGAQRIRRPLYQRAPMLTLLERGGLPVRTRPDEPLLAVAVTSVLAGELRLLNSDERAIEPLHVAASAAIPLMFEPVQIDGELFWDGDMVHGSPIPPLLALLRDSGRWAPPEPLQLVTVEQYPAAVARRPTNSREIAWRVMALLQRAKYVEGHALAPGLRLLRIVRPPLPQDAISGEFDYSPERIGILVAQGADAARQALETWTPAGHPARAREARSPA